MKTEAPAPLNLPAINKDSIVFIDEGNEFVMSDEFAQTIQNTDNYYVIVTREGIPSLPYSVEEIYGIRDSGKYGTLKRTYNELYHLFDTDLYQTADNYQAINNPQTIRKTAETAEKISPSNHNTKK